MKKIEDKADIEKTNLGGVLRAQGLLSENMTQMINAIESVNYENIYLEKQTYYGLEKNLKIKQY